MLIPLGLVEVPRRRIPWVSLGLGLSCTLIFLVDDVRMDRLRENFELTPEFRAYWRAHPYLAVPPEVKRAIDSKEYAEIVELSKPFWFDGKVPPENVARQEHAQMMELLNKPLEDPWQRDWGLVPSKGLVQPGWITSIFLHGGWAHLIGNMIFFALVGPVLEELLTPFVFLGFYLLGGLVAGVAQFLVSPESPVPIIGASGAIAACMGTFTIRFASAHLRLLWLRGFTPRIVEWPTWVWAILWVGEQGLMLFLGGVASGGVAVMAHLGGFGFGVGTAVLLKVTGLGGRLESALPPPKEPPSPHAPVDPLEQAAAFLDAGQGHAAFDGYREVLKRDPTNLPAQWGLARSLFLLGEADEGSRVFDAVVARWIASGSQAFVEQAVKLIAKDLDPRELRPAHASIVARALESLDPKKARLAWEIAASDSKALAIGQG